LEYYSSSMIDLEKRQDEIARRVLKLVSLGVVHDSSDSDVGVDGPSLDRRINKVKVARRKIYVGSENEDDGFETELENTKTTQVRVINNAEDIEAFKRIHALTKEKEKRYPDQNNSESIWDIPSQEGWELIKEFWLALIA